MIEWLPALIVVPFVVLKFYILHRDRELKALADNDELTRIDARMEAKRAFYKLASALQLNPKASGDSSFSASSDHYTACLHTASRPIQSEYIFEVIVPGCEPNLTLASLTHTRSPTRYQTPLLTGDPAFDAVISVKRPDHPYSGSVCVLSSQSRQALVAAASRAHIRLSAGKLRYEVIVTQDTLQLSACTRWINEARALVSLLDASGRPSERLSELALTDPSAPRLRAFALRALIDHGLVPQAQLVGLCQTLLNNPKTPSKLRLWATIGLGPDGVPLLLDYLQPGVSESMQAAALRHLAARLPPADLEQLIEAIWPTYLQTQSVALLKQLLACLKRFPALGRLEALSAHLRTADLSLLAALLDTMEAQPEPFDMVEGLILPLLLSADTPRLKLLTASLQARGGPSAIVAIKALIEVEVDDFRRDLLQSALFAIKHRLSQDSAAGQLSLSADGGAGEVSLVELK